MVVLKGQQYILLALGRALLVPVDVLLGWARLAAAEVSVRVFLIHTYL